MKGPRVHYERKLLRNEWTGTHHVTEKCRGLRSSRAPHVTVHVPWSVMAWIKTCGYCMPNPKEKGQQP